MVTHIQSSHNGAPNSTAAPVQQCSVSVNLNSAGWATDCVTHNSPTRERHLPHKLPHSYSYTWDTYPTLTSGPTILPIEESELCGSSTPATPRGSSIFNLQSPANSIPWIYYERTFYVAERRPVQARPSPLPVIIWSALPSRTGLPFMSTKLLHSYSHAWDICSPQTASPILGYIYSIFNVNLAANHIPLKKSRNSIGPSAPVAPR